MGPITDAHKLAYKANITLALQQMRSKFEVGFSYVSGLSGRLAQMIELVGAVDAIDDATRKADTPDIDGSIEQVWVAPRRLIWGKLMEREDQIKGLNDYQSVFVQAGAKAMMRGKDRVLRDAVFANRRIGQDGTTSSAWSGSSVAAAVGSSDGNATGMNVAKILRVVRYLTSAQIDVGSENVFISMNSQGVEELFKDNYFINSDYRGIKQLDTPLTHPILGVTFLPANDGMSFTDYDASTYTFAAWCKSGLHWGDFDPLRTDIPLRPDKMNYPHPQAEHWLGAARSEDAKVVKILSKK